MTHLRSRIPLAPALLAALGASSPAVADELIRRSFEVEGVERTALVYAPEQARTTPSPLVLVFHGHGGTMRGIARAFALHRHWPEAIVVYPEGLRTPGRYDPEGLKSGWQKGPGDQEDRDLALFDTILADLREDFTVDPGRIHATGHSNGGGFTYLLWAERGELLASIAPSSSAGGRFLRANPPPPRPVLHVAGRADEIVPFEAQERVIAAVLRHHRCAEGAPWGEEPGWTRHPSPLGAPVVTFLHDGGHRFSQAAPARIAEFFRAHSLAAATPKVRVFVLAGQSNMEGHGQLHSLARLGEHPEHGEWLARLRAEDGSWAVRDDVTIVWSGREPQSGLLGVGWGAGKEAIGPELMFGTVAGERIDAPVLLIKTAWGGKDVYCDFRSPSAGEPSAGEAALLERERAGGREREIGATYREMVGQIQDALERIDELVPGYEGQGFELEGLAWFQGWNDYCQWHVRERERPIGAAPTERYAHNLAALVADLRRELGVADLPVAVGEMGVGGVEVERRAVEDGAREAQAMMAFRRAQRAAAEAIEGAVFVPTAAFWDERLEQLRRQSEDWRAEKREQGIADTADNVLPTPELSAEFRSLGGHWYCHYNGSAATYSLVGFALADALVPVPR
ncbi:MAG: hypothetical protein CMJ84_16070 [Planctomycetes bacterium]|jgi:polyhydroxybutyrate depolymerase|nr:hypothetical protein [Planctomycetota bacterium]MDP6407905.1 sialate O-acetylesterase [Planctomycetota bacterium]